MVLLIFTNSPISHAQSLLNGQCAPNPPTNGAIPPCSLSNVYAGQYNADLGCGNDRAISSYSPGTYFRMPVLTGGCYTVNTCGAPIDTQIGAFKPNTTINPFAFNDDGGPACTGNRASINMVPTFTGYARVDVRQFNCLPGGTASITVRIRQNNNLNFTSSSASMCGGQTRTLTATPLRTAAIPLTGSGNRGTFTGTGVTGTTFTAPISTSASQVYTITYTFGYCTTTQDITVFRNPSTSNAGANQNLSCDATTATLGATAPTFGTGLWSVLTGTGTVTTPTSPTSGVTGLTPGASTTFRWTFTNGPCTASTSITISSSTDVTAPVADAATLADVTDECSVTTLTDPTATDNCGGVVTVSSDATLPIITQGTTVVTWTYTDVNGNASMQMQNVVLIDSFAPTASNPADSSYECIGDAIIDVTVVTDEADNCTAPITVTHVSDVVTGNGIPKMDTITRTYNVADGSGNNIDVVQMIFIEDVTAPTASNPLDLTVQCIGEVPAPITGWVSDEADNCGVPTVAFVSDVSDGLTCPETITRTFSVTDAFGNTIDVVQMVIVLDIDAPIVDVAALLEITSLCDVTPSTPTATDNCVGSVDGTSGVTFPITALGTTTITWTYIDVCGNTSSQTQDVTISSIDVTTTMASDLITIVANNHNPGVTHQWIDCDSNTSIAGETDHNYTPTYGGNFAVIVTQDGCSDTSDCVVSVVGIDEMTLDGFVLYPNPTNTGSFTIVYEGELREIIVVDMLGRVIQVEANLETKTVNTSRLESGKYMVLLHTESDTILQQTVVVIR